MANRDFQVENYNDDFLLIKSENSSELVRLGRAIFHRKFHFVSEVIVTEKEIAVQLNDRVEKEDIQLIFGLELDSKKTTKTYQLPVLFEDGEDWKEIEYYSGISRKEVESELLNADLQISMFGFLPGFMYVEGLPEFLHLPRKKIPSKHVKESSLALGGKYLGLYAIDSPGGWYVIGKTPISILDWKNLPPVHLNPGDRIALVKISEKEFTELSSKKLTLKNYNS